MDAMTSPTIPTQNQFEAELRERIENKTAQIGIIGLGYVGLP